MVMVDAIGAPHVGRRDDLVRVVTGRNEDAGPRAACASVVRLTASAVTMAEGCPRPLLGATPRQNGGHALSCFADIVSHLDRGDGLRTVWASLAAHLGRHP